MGADYSSWKYVGEYYRNYIKMSVNTQNAPKPNKTDG